MNLRWGNSMVGCSQGRTRVDTCKSEKDSDENRHRGLVKRVSLGHGRIIIFFQDSKLIVIFRGSNSWRDRSNAILTLHYLYRVSRLSKKIL